MHACHVSLTGYCPKMSLWQEHVPCEGWLYHVWIPETLAHVYHSDAWNDQPNFVYRYAYVCRNANFFLLPIFLSISYSLSLPKYLLDCHLVTQIVQAHVYTKTNYSVRSHMSSLFPWSQVSANAILGERNSTVSLPSCLFIAAPLWLNGWKMLSRADSLLAIGGRGSSVTDYCILGHGQSRVQCGRNANLPSL